MEQHLQRRPLLYHFATVHQHQVIRQPQRLINIVSHQNNRPPEQPMDADHLLLERFPGHRIQRAKRFVHQQDFRIGRQRPRHANALLLTAGELMRIARPQRRIQPQQRH